MNMNTTLNLILVLDVPPHSYFHSLLCMIGGHSQAQNVDGCDWSRWRGRWVWLRYCVVLYHKVS